MGKAILACGEDIERKAVWVVNKLRSREKVRNASEALQMDHEAAAKAIASLRKDFQRIWPNAQIDDGFFEGNDQGM